MHVKQQIAPTTLTGSGTNVCRFLTIHETANTARGANAQAHANLQSRAGIRQASWHYQVDDREAIQSHPNKRVCWHAGTPAGNANSIGIEICVNADGNFTKTIENAAQLAAQVLREENIPVERMVQHNYWSGKNCPTFLRQKGWNAFVARVRELLKDTDSKPAPEAPKPPSAAKPSSKDDFIAGKTIAQIADEVIAGKHGTGNVRKQRLGSKYAAVQAEVNRRLTGKTSKPSKPKPVGKTVAQMATEVITGKHGNGHAARQKSLKIDSATYAKVRAEVNRRLK
jgi:N-acetylmuramoyl-L-alanine amidase CwlA